MSSIKAEKTDTVIFKRITKHGGLNSNRSKWTYSNNYTVDCKYPDSEKLHTFRCEKNCL